jgi:hypothetical protein
MMSSASDVNTHYLFLFASEHGKETRQHHSRRQCRLLQTLRIVASGEYTPVFFQYLQLGDTGRRLVGHYVAVSIILHDLLVGWDDDDWEVDEDSDNVSTTSAAKLPFNSRIVKGLSGIHTPPILLCMPFIKR